jgi:hypothetical protein
LDLFFKDAASMFKTLEHIKARTRRREQNNVARFRRRESTLNGISHRRRVFERSGRTQLAFDRFSIVTD